MPDDREFPKEVMSPMSESWIAIHEMFQLALEAGFTEWQACRIVAVVIVENGRQE